MVSPREASSGRGVLLEAVKSSVSTGGFDADVWHVIDDRDNALIADELLNGSASSKFVYSFDITGTKVTGISVIGARHLAATYGGLKHRIVGSVQKIGALHTFKSYPAPNMPMLVQVQIIPELASEPDYYEALVELTDLKTGNTVQVEKRELRLERKRDGSYFERPHYQIIAQSKAYRNGVLSLIPQDVQLEWKAKQLALGKNIEIAHGVREEKLGAILQFAAAKALPFERRQLEELTMDQISGLREAAKEGLEVFTSAALNLGLVAQAEPETAKATKTPPPKAKEEPPPGQDATGAPHAGVEPAAEKQESPHDPETGEIKPEPEAPAKRGKRAPTEELFK